MKLYYYKGESLSLRAICTKYNLDYELIRGRINEHWPLTQAINTPKQISQQYLFNGQSKTLKEWSKELNIKYYTLVHRVYGYNWPIDRALTEPTNTQFRRKK